MEPLMSVSVLYDFLYNEKDISDKEFSEIKVRIDESIVKYNNSAEAVFNTNNLSYILGNHLLLRFRKSNKTNIS